MYMRNSANISGKIPAKLRKYRHLNVISIKFDCSEQIKLNLNTR